MGKTPPEVKRRKIFLPALLAGAGVVAGVALGLTRGGGSGLAAAGVVLVVAALLFIIRDPPPPKAGSGHPASIDFGKK